jgi:TPR repeat protein
MPTSRLKKSLIVAVGAAMLLGVLPAAGQAFDRKEAESSKQSPWAVFKFGFSAYKRGEKKEAVEAYRYAAENGQIGATWKLGRMYAQGDGVKRDDYEAFKFFSAIASQDVEAGSPDEAYVSDALVAVAGYLRSGIPGTPVVPNPLAAQDYYMRAAANYRNPAAQFEMGRMYLLGEGVRQNLKQAGRWLQLATEKGHSGAQALLGNLLYESGKVVQGLALMTAALERASPGDQQWIRGMQEEAFALAAENDRRTAIALSQDILSGKKK